MNNKLKIIFSFTTLMAVLFLTTGCVERGMTSEEMMEEVMMSQEMMEEVMMSQEMMEDQLADLEMRRAEMENDMSSMGEVINAENASLASSDEVTVWIDHFIIRRASYTVGDEMNVHVHVKRRDKLDEIWNGKITVSVGADVKERSISLSNKGDDHYDYSFSAGKRGVGTVTVKAEISDDVGILDIKEYQILVS